MLNRNAARHLLLVVSILICAFIYAGYSLRTRGDGEPPEPAAAPAAQQGAGASGLRPSSPADTIPSARGEDLALVPPVGSSTRPSSPPPAVAPSAASGAITGLVPSAAASSAPSASNTTSAAPATTLPLSNAAPGTALPLPGFSSPAGSGESGGSSSPPVLTLPGMGTPADDDDEPDDDGGDFAFLPGSGSAPASSSAPALTPPPSSSPSTPSRGTTLAPPPPAASSAGTPPATSAAGTGTGTVRPPSRQNGGMATDAQTPPPPPTNRPSTPSATGTPPAPARTPPAPARTTPAPPSRTPLPPPPGPGVRPSAEEDVPRSSDSLRIYVVAPGDTLSSIAMRELGSGFLADNIFLLNRDVIDDPNHLLAGVKIRLPYANPADSSGPAANANGAGLTPPGRRPTQGLGGTHTVVSGDTLSSIALRYYGTSAGWRFLYEANKTTVPSPDKLSVGMELTIPPYEQ